MYTIKYYNGKSPLYRYRRYKCYEIIIKLDTYIKKNDIMCINKFKKNDIMCINKFYKVEVRNKTVPTAIR